MPAQSPSSALKNIATLWGGGDAVAELMNAGETNAIRSGWDLLAPLPFGKKIFSRAVGRGAPYTGTIGAEVLELRPGYALVELRDRPHVRNHLSCVHAIALANLAEVTGNLALGYSLPNDARFIVAGLQMEYLTKARGTLRASSEVAPIATNVKTEYDLRVEIRDASGAVVTRATLNTLVGPKTKR